MSTEAQRKSPTPIKLASVVWVLYGAALLMSSVFALIAGLTGPSVAIAFAVGAPGAIFLYSGVSTFRATAGGTFGRGICGMLFGAMLAYSNLDNSLNLLAGVGLVVSGIVFVAFREQYNAAIAPAPSSSAAVPATR